MSSETKYHLAEKFRKNWQSQYPFTGRKEHCSVQKNVLKHINLDVVSSVVTSAVNGEDTVDDSLTNLNWLQNLNLLFMPQCQSPLSPSPGSYVQCQVPIMKPTANPTHLNSRITHPFFESNALYAEVAQNLEFMNQEASAHFFQVNNQLRPPFSDINLISMAIFSYNKNKVSFPEICRWIEETFPYYKIINQDWKVGIKNNLTLSKCFQKVPRRKDEAEKGGFWRFSNDFLNYLGKNRLLGIKFDEIMVNVQQENANQIQYKYGKLVPRKRTMSFVESQDENNNSAFKIPNKKSFLDESQLFSGLPNFGQLVDTSLGNDRPQSFIMSSDEGVHQACTSIQSGPITSRCDAASAGRVALLTTSSDLTSLSQLFETSKFEQGIFQDTIGGIQIPMQMSNPTCPEQLTEEEFLSGRLFNHNFLSSQSNLENIPTLLDSQMNFNSSDFNINNLSITGVGIRPPEWWNQSFSASQINISKLGFSLRSLTSVGNIERGSPFGEEDQHINWHADQNLEELDILFGLS